MVSCASEKSSQIGRIWYHIFPEIIVNYITDIYEWHPPIIEVNYYCDCDCDRRR